MELMTRCPACGTTFAASLEQLQLRKGYVRCVGCAHIFDGYDAVVPSTAAEPHMPKPEAQPSPAAPAYRSPGARRPDEAGPASEPFLGAGPPQGKEGSLGQAGRAAAEPRGYSFSAGRSSSADAEPSFSADPGFGADDAEPSFKDEPGFIAGDAARDDEDDATSIYGETRASARAPVPGFLAGDEPVRRSGLARFAWAVLILAGLLLALAQAAYVYRMQLAVQWPWLRPWLETACLRLDCKVPYARSISHLSITDSSLQRQAESGDRQGGRRMVFEALLRNSLGAPQQWPVLWLELTDVSGAVLSRRYLPPDIYLAPRPGGPAMAASSERRISVMLEVESEHVSGYQVGLFFP